MKTGAVIVSAGLSSRMGDFKPMMNIGSISIVKRLILTMQQAGCSPVVLVTGYQAELLEKHVARMGVICLRNPNYASTQMFDSAKIGLEFLKDKCVQVLFSPVDVPLYTIATLTRLIYCGAKLAVPVCEGREGHPLLLATVLLPMILSYKGDQGLAGAVSACGYKKQLIEVEDHGILYDADTSDDYSQLMEMHNSQLLRPYLNVRISREKAFFGPEMAMLLTLIDSTGSVKAACRQMNISYTKVWEALFCAEDQLGFQLVNRRQGGKNGGGADLTWNGREFLRRYEKFEQESREAVEEIFIKQFPEYA